MNKERGKRKQFLKVFLMLLAIFGALIVIGMRLYTGWAKPPETESEAPKSEALDSAGKEESDAENVDAERTGETYTFLLVGNDDGRGNTDTILVGRLDTGAHCLDVVSIPRDTLVNLPWDIRKINAVYAGWANSGHVGIDGLKKHIRNLTGFTVDCYAVIDLDVFIKAIDLIGGVDFDLPRDMHYDDPNQDLHIHLNAGEQHLNGQQAMGVVRFRSGYANGDLGRVEMQQKFFKAVAGQFIKLGNIPHLPELVTLLAENMDTDLSAGNIAFFIQEALKCDSENVRFHTMPNIPATVAGLSYDFVDLEPWLQMINEVLNPFDQPITADNLDAVYLANGIHATTGVLVDPGYYSRPSIFETESTPEPTPAPTPAPAAPVPVQTQAPAPTPTPEPQPTPTPESTPAPTAETENTPQPEATSQPDPEPTPSEPVGEDEVIITG